MSQINISNVTFAYEGAYDNVFENVSFQMDTDWRLGFTGRNGRGKTTFLNLLMGKYEYEGIINASTSFDYFPFEVADQTQLTLFVAQEINPELEEWQLRKELAMLEMDDEVLYRPFMSLSHGERTRVLLAVLFLRENHFLLIDEPTNHLDMEGRITLASYLKRKKGFILVSHDRNFLDECIDHVLSINLTNIEIQKGNFSSWLHNKTLQDGFEMAENEKLKKDIQRLGDASKRTANWSDRIEATKNGSLNSGSKLDKGYVGHQAAKMMQKAKNTEKRQNKAIEEKSKLLKNIEKADSLIINKAKHHADKLVTVENLGISYDDQTICQGISFEIKQGDRIVLTGKNGTGKSSVLKALLTNQTIKQNRPQLQNRNLEPSPTAQNHNLEPSPIESTIEPQMKMQGTIQLASGLIISYVSQDTSFLKGHLSDFAREQGIDESLFKTTLAKLDFNQRQFEKNMEDFSGGQKKKVLLAKSLCQQAHLYIWDEPLNFVDVLSRMQIENLVLDYELTILFVEHDSAFVEAVATKKVAIHK